MEWGQPYTYTLEGRNADGVVILKHSDTITAGTSSADNITGDDNQFGWNGSELTVSPSLIGQTLTIYAADGRLVSTAIIDSTAIKPDMEPGVYVAKTAAASFKFVKY